MVCSENPIMKRCKTLNWGTIFIVQYWYVGFCKPTLLAILSTLTRACYFMLQCSMLYIVIETITKAARMLLISFQIRDMLVLSFWRRKHRKNCECCPVSLLIVRSQWLSWLSGSQLSEMVTISHSSQAGHVSSSLWSNVSEVTIL